MTTPLKYRNELKFFVNLHQYRIISQRLKNLVTYDQHAGPAGNITFEACTLMISIIKPYTRSWRASGIG